MATDFGIYKRFTQPIEEGKYLVKREFVLHKGVYSPKQYDDFRNFIKDVQKYDRQKMVMVNKS